MGGSVSVCICTYRRGAQLAELLAALPEQTPQGEILEVVVVDNDAEGSARSVVEQFSATKPPFAVQYEIQPLKNISLTRNRTVALARGEWLAMIDDDELPDAGWISKLLACQRQTGAAGVLAPVIPVIPPGAPRWIDAGHFYDWQRFATGTPIPRNAFRTGNVLVSTALMRSIEGPFDPEYGLTGGEDSRLFNLLANAGARFVWCDEATVREPIVAGRMTLRWLLLRAFRGGNDHARHVVSGAYGRGGVLAGGVLAVRAAAQAVVALGLSVALLPLGRHHAARWLFKSAANVGKLAALLKLRYQEYA